MIEPKYDAAGLVPCVVQDAQRGTVLMLAWMNAEALRLTRESGVVHFWSRSRQSLWKKGATSGNTLALVELRIDCDLDCVLVRARPAGPTCHTGATTCFFHRDDGPDDDGNYAATILEQLDQVLAERRDAAPVGGMRVKPSYTKSLLDAGMPKILEKIAEESGELAAELPAGEDGKVIHETADLIFHVMVGLTARKIPITAVLDELARRFGTSGHTEKASRTK